MKKFHLIIGLIVIAIVTSLIFYLNGKTLQPDSTEKEVIIETETSLEKSSSIRENPEKEEEQKPILGKYDTPKEYLSESLLLLPEIRVALQALPDLEAYHSSEDGYSFSGSYSGVESFEYDHDQDGLQAWFVGKNQRDKLMESRNCDVLKESRVYLPVNFEYPNLCELLTNEQGIDIVIAVGIEDGIESFASLQTMILALDEKRYVVFDGFLDFPEERKKAQEFLKENNHDQAEWASDAWVAAAEAIQLHFEKRMKNPSAEIVKHLKSLKEISKDIHFVSR
jgi:uncharacterized membrane protein YhiD involved in acid resistance